MKYKVGDRVKLIPDKTHIDIGWRFDSTKRYFIISCNKVNPCSVCQKTRIFLDDAIPRDYCISTIERYADWDKI